MEDLDPDFLSGKILIYHIIKSNITPLKTDAINRYFGSVGAERSPDRRSNERDREYKQPNNDYDVDSESRQSNKHSES